MTIGMLFETYEAGLLTYLIGFCGNRAAAEDARSQAFVRAVEHAELLETMPDKAAKAWLFATARNASVDAVRRSRPVVSDPALYEAIAAPDGSDRLLLDDALARLTRQQREIVVLRHSGGYTSAEIGARLSMPESTVRYHLACAMRQLRRYFKEG